MTTILSFPNLSGPRISLVQLDESALPDIVAYSRMPEFFRYFEFEPHRSVDETRRYFGKLLRRSDDTTGHYWMVRLEDESRVIGTIGVLNLDGRTRCSELGYGLSPAYWGRGYFHEALALVLCHMFESLNFHRVWAKTRADNSPSIRALERAGFKREGILRDFYFSERDGRYCDAIIYSILDHEFDKTA